MNDNDDPDQKGRKQWNSKENVKQYDGEWWMLKRKKNTINIKNGTLININLLNKFKNFEKANKNIYKNLNLNKLHE